MLDRYAGSKASVAIVGESGTGKKAVVKALHVASGGVEAPLVMQDRSRVPDALVRELIFGDSQGSGVRSLFEVVSGGIVYLKGLQGLGDGLQRDLLHFWRAIRVRSVRGSWWEVRVLWKLGSSLVSFGAIFAMPVGAVFAAAGIASTARGLARGCALLAGPTAAAMRCLLRYAWPGNLRELEQEVARLAVLCESRVEKDDLSPSTASRGARARNDRLRA